MICKPFQIGFLRALLALFVALPLFAAAASDTLTVGTASAPAGGSAQVPVYVRDGASTSLGSDAGAGNRIQAIAFKATWSSPASVAGVTFARAGVTNSLTPLYEQTVPSANAIGYLVSFAESSNPIPFTLDGATPGDRIGTLLVTFAADAVEGTVVTLTVDAGTAMLSNEAGTTAETTTNGLLSLTAGAATVERFATTASVSSSGSPSVFGASVTFTATVSSGAPGAMTGSVTFKDGGTTLGTATLSGGTASLSTSELAVGSHSITATYGGDTNYAPSSSPAITQQVNTPPFGAPGNVVATAASGSQVIVTWNPVGDAVFYEVFRSSNGLAGFAAAGVSNGTIFTDNAVSGSVTYLYKVRAVNGSSLRSAFSAIDPATTIVFTDAPIVAGVTRVRGVHVDQLRTAVNAFRATAGEGPYVFEDAATPGTVIRASHIQQLRAALSEARSALSLPPVTYIDQSLGAGTTIRKMHIQQLRDAVK